MAKEIKEKQIDFIIDDIMTSEQVANYYEVGIDAIQIMITRHRKEFDKSGLKVLKSNELKEFKKNLQNKSIVEKLKFVSKLTILNYDSILLTAFYLQNNHVANKVKIEILKVNSELYKYYEDITISKGYKKRFEKGFEEVIYPLFNKHNKIEKQVQCGKYFIDFVINDKIAIEIDENGHKDYDVLNEIKRERAIKAKGYKLLRFNPEEQDCLEFIGEIIELLK
jgi:very-short-patch-repair endonuclease